MTQLDLGSTYYLELFITDIQGDPVSGLSITYTISDSSDDSVIESGSLTEVGGGIYKKAKTWNNVGQFRVVYTTPINYSDEIETILIKEEAESDAVLHRILGLSQENYRIFNPAYIKKNGQQCMTSATIKTYSTALDCTNDTNKLAEYQITATFDAEARMSSYKVIKV
jgi:hypothetical protein